MRMRFIVGPSCASIAVLALVPRAAAQCGDPQDWTHRQCGLLTTQYVGSHEARVEFRLLQGGSAVTNAAGNVEVEGNYSFTGGSLDVPTTWPDYGLCSESDWVPVHESDSQQFDDDLDYPGDIVSVVGACMPVPFCASEAIARVRASSSEVLFAMVKGRHDRTSGSVFQQFNNNVDACCAYMEPGFHPLVSETRAQACAKASVTRDVQYTAASFVQPRVLVSGLANVSRGDPACVGGMVDLCSAFHPGTHFGTAPALSGGTSASFVDIVVTVTGATAYTRRIRGVVGATTAATIIRAGAFAPGTYTVGSTCQSGAVRSASYFGDIFYGDLGAGANFALDPIATPGSTISLDARVCPVKRPGDVNDDDVIGPLDQAGFYALFNHDIDDETSDYIPECDVNFDGLIDSLDWPELTAAGYCPGDFDASGSINTNDFFDYLAAYQALDLLADINGSGAVDSNDYFLFLEYYQNGC